MQESEASNSRACAGLNLSAVHVLQNVRGRAAGPPNRDRDAGFVREIFSKHALLYAILNKESNGKCLYDQDDVTYFIRLGLHDSNMQATLKTNFEYWLTDMKESGSRDIGSRLYNTIPKMPRGWPLAASGSSDLTPNKMTQFRGMLSKYNYEYRRPFLEEAFPVLDAWKNGG